MPQVMLFEELENKKFKEIVKENTKEFLNKTNNKEGFIKMRELILKVKKFIEENKNERFIVVHDKDADGQSSGGIMYYTLKYGAGIKDVEKWASNRFDFDRVVEEYGKDNIFIFTDLGSGQTNLIKNAGIDLSKTIIFDHHLKLIDTYARFEVNPNFFGFSGTFEISGAGMTYLLAREYGLTKLSQIAIVGATGDMQNTFYGLRGLNRILLEDGVKSGFVKIRVGLPIFGRETRPLFKSLQLLSEPKLFRSKEHVYAFLFNEAKFEFVDTKKPLNDIGADIFTDPQTGELSTKEKVLQKLIYIEYIRKAPILLKPFASIFVTGENYELLSFQKGTPLRDSKEFATLLNAMNRQGRVSDIGIELTSFNHEKVIRQALSIQRKVRRELAKSIREISNELSERKMNYKFMVVLDETGVVQPHATGTILQMLIDQLTPLYNKPLVGFTRTDDGVKVSLRESKILYLNDLNLAVAVERSASKVGGVGGGHSVACGAKVPEDRLEDFLEILHKELYKQAIEKKILF